MSELKLFLIYEYLIRVLFGEDSFDYFKVNYDPMFAPWKK